MFASSLCNILLDNGSSINIQNKNGLSPLHLANLKGSISCTKYLIEMGADVNLKDNTGKTPLHYAAFNGDTGITEILLSKGTPGMVCLVLLLSVILTFF